jgi:hypothetical protein
VDVREPEYYGDELLWEFEWTQHTLRYFGWKVPQGIGVHFADRIYSPPKSQRRICKGGTFAGTKFRR